MFSSQNSMLKTNHWGSGPWLMPTMWKTLPREKPAGVAWFASARVLNAWELLSRWNKEKLNKNTQVMMSRCCNLLFSSIDQLLKPKRHFPMCLASLHRPLGSATHGRIGCEVSIVIIEHRLPHEVWRLNATEITSHRKKNYRKKRRKQWRPAWITLFLLGSWMMSKPFFSTWRICKYANSSQPAGTAPASWCQPWSWWMSMAIPWNPLNLEKTQCKMTEPL